MARSDVIVDLKMALITLRKYHIWKLTPHLLYLLYEIRPQIINTDLFIDR